MHLLSALLLALALGACRAAPTDRPPSAASADTTKPPATGAVDSILPMPVLLERFRAGVPATDSLAGGRRSRDALVRAFVAAMERADSAALDSLLLTREEFAWVYFPAHIYSRAPYELAPATFWELTAANGAKGRRRLLDRLSGQSLGFTTYACAASRAVQAPLEEWRDCRLRLLVGGAPQEMRLFGSIVALRGRFKLVSLANDF